METLIRVLDSKTGDRIALIVEFKGTNTVRLVTANECIPCIDACEAKLVAELHCFPDTQLTFNAIQA